VQKQILAQLEIAEIQQRLQKMWPRNFPMRSGARNLRSQIKDPARVGEVRVAAKNKRSNWCPPRGSEAAGGM